MTTIAARRPARARPGVGGLACAVVLTMLSGYRSVGAAPMRPLSFEALLEHADCVVHGVVEEVTTEPGPEGRGVRTRARLRVAECYLGADHITGDSVTVLQGGGALGAVVEVPSVSAAFRPGQERILFLRATAQGELLVLGVVQGVYDVVRSAAPPRVRRMLGAGTAPALPRHETGAADAPSAAGQPSPAPASLETLDAFLDRLRAAAGARRTTPTTPAVGQ